VTHNPSRKQFFGKLLGAVTTASVLPKVLANSAAAPVAAAASPSPKAPRVFQIRADARAVARRDSV
jgi:hypothetical protein